MMKWLVGALVLANVAFFMWGAWYHKPLISSDPPRPPIDIAPDKMMLLNEPGIRLVVRAPGQTAARAPENDSEPRCYQLGPFHNLEKARAAGARLGAWGLAYERLAEFETLGPAYRVVIPPLPSAEAAERKRRELTKLGLNDHAVIQNEQGMENAISLGIFSVEQNARARAQQLINKGIVPLIQPVPNVHPIYWLAIVGPAAEGRLGEVPLERFPAEDWGAPNIELRPKACGS